MQSYLYIGGNQDSLNIPTPDGADYLQLPVGVTGQETYTRLALTLADVTITVYVHESMTPEQALGRLVESYKAWCVNQPGGRR